MLDTSRVTDMGSMFSGAHNFTGKGLENFNTSRVTTMISMFNNVSYTHQRVSKDMLS
jgi:surface protein